MNEHSRTALADYYREAATWNQDRVRSAQSSQRVAWYIAAGAAIVAALEAVAIAILTPLKTVETYTLMVDRSTGYVQALKPLDQAMVAPDTALTQSFLVQYVVARESFDINTAQTNHRRVALFSGDRARSTYLRRMQATSPDNPINVYPRNTIIEARVKSVSPVGRNTAFVRFDTIRTDPNGQPQAAMPWVAVIRYSYSGEPMKLEDRFVNPLGFRVTHYRRDAEAMPTTGVSRGAAVLSRPTLRVEQPRAETTTTVPAAPRPDYYQGQRR